MTYKAIIFDFDYTLGDATDSIVAGFYHSLLVMGYPLPDRETIRHTVGLLLEDAYTQLTGDATVEGRATFRKHFSAVAHPMQNDHTPLCLGADDLLRSLHEKGIATAIVSTKHGVTLNQIMASHQLTDMVSPVIGGDMVPAPKPDPTGLQAAIVILGLTAGDVLYCGDTTIDAQTAKNAGVDFCAVLNGTTKAEAFEAYPHVLIAQDLPTLQEWLGK